MKATHIVPIAAFAATVLLGGCATHGMGGTLGSRPNDMYGVIESINISIGRSSSSGVGAPAGDQAVGGAVGGTALESSNESRRYSIAVLLDNGRYETITQAGSVADLRKGDRVRIKHGLAYQG